MLVLFSVLLVQRSLSLAPSRALLQPLVLKTSLDFLFSVFGKMVRDRKAALEF